MRFLLPLFALFVFSFSSCEKNEVLLNRIAGSYEVDQITLVPEFGADTTFTLPELALTFAQCNATDNREGGDCDLMVSGEQDFQLRYQVFKTGGDTEMNIRTAATTGNATETLAYQVLNGTYSYELNNDDLTLSANTDSTIPFRVEGRTYIIKEITATRR